MTAEKFAKIRNKPKRGAACPKAISTIGLCGCELLCANAYNSCLAQASNTLNNALDRAVQITNPTLAQEQIDLAIYIFYLDAAECGIQYVVCGLGCLVAFSLF